MAQGYHDIVIRGGRVLRVPTSLPNHIAPYLPNQKQAEEEIEDFKRKLKEHLKHNDDHV